MYVRRPGWMTWSASWPRPSSSVFSQSDIATPWSINRATPACVLPPEDQLIRSQQDRPVSRWEERSPRCFGPLQGSLRREESSCPQCRACRIPACYLITSLAPTCPLGAELWSDPQFVRRVRMLAEGRELLSQRSDYWFGLGLAPLREIIRLSGSCFHTNKLRQPTMERSQ